MGRGSARVLIVHAGGVRHGGREARHARPGLAVEDARSARVLQEGAVGAGKPPAPGLIRLPAYFPVSGCHQGPIFVRPLTGLPGVLCCNVREMMCGGGQEKER